MVGRAHGFMGSIGRKAASLGGILAAILVVAAIRPGASRIPAFTVVDDTGKFVGRVVELGTRTDDPWWGAPAGGVPTVLVRFDENDVLFRLGSPNDLRLSRTVYYQGSGCTGTAKGIPNNFDQLRGELHAIGTGGWLLRGTGKETRIDYQSWARDGSSCQETGFATLSEVPWELEAVLDLEEVFTPPFHVRP